MRAVTLATLVATFVSFGVVAGARGQARDEQGVLGPGLYAFQLRITGATCGDADRTGFVRSFFASVEGIPGARQMVLRLIDSSYWPRWELDIDPSGRITGLSRNERIRGTNRVELRPSGGRFVGTGTRSYARGDRRCEVSYDALLRRLDR